MLLSGETNILVATDIASRGLDTTKVSNTRTDSDASDLIPEKLQRPKVPMQSVTDFWSVVQPVANFRLFGLPSLCTKMAVKHKKLSFSCGSNHV